MAIHWELRCIPLLKTRLSVQGFQTGIEFYFVGNEHFAGFGTSGRADYAGSFELVHQSSGTDETNGDLAQEARSGHMLVNGEKAGRFVEQGVELVGVQIGCSSSTLAVHFGFGQFEG